MRQRQIVEFWSYLVAEVRELEVATGRDVRVAALIQTTEKQGSSAVDVECEYFKKGRRMQTWKFVSTQTCEVVIKGRKVLQLWSTWSSSKRVSST